MFNIYNTHNTFFTFIFCSYLGLVCENYILPIKFIDFLSIKLKENTQKYSFKSLNSSSFRILTQNYVRVCERQNYHNKINETIHLFFLNFFRDSKLKLSFNQDKKEEMPVSKT